MQNRTAVKEIFTSIQGEGPFVGLKQLFIRFTKCNLKCNYCDTNFQKEANTKEFTPIELLNELKNYDTNNIHSISLTGGEPLLEADFLKEFIPLTNKKIYLETNGTLFNELEKVIENIDFVSMDIKLDTASKNNDLFSKHENFIEICKKHKKNIFAKIVFDGSITDAEIEKCINLVKDFEIELILQPLMIGVKTKASTKEIIDVFNKFANKYEKVRLIPQTHKFIDIE